MQHGACSEALTDVSQFFGGDSVAAVGRTGKARFGFSKANRLLKRIAFVGLSRKGKRIQDNNFILCHSAGETAEVRLGITVTRKVGGAVQRNRIKRLCREYFRCHRQGMTSARDINIIAKRQAAECDNETVRCSLAKLFKALTW